MEKFDFPPLLGIGFHDMSMDDLERLCVRPFLNSTTRQQIMDGLKQTLGTLSTNRVKGHAWIDGSFLTEKNNPEDSDVLVVVQDSDVTDQKQAASLDWFSKEDLKRDYKCDSYVFRETGGMVNVDPSNEIMRAYWIRQFSFDRSQQPKGIARVKLPFSIGQRT